eukprot:CAMPEP_0117561132 /NCGR_PEP_ID=MMETSP0784-20121206/54243_1 /TAXON_ID=39447 /ORGANISM="" /LENGTH=50 /DNA_ID=CAMNT_0005358581 /DNA_START=25 /DNA_END=173 /DNA_ORIENTATION=+
MDEGSIRDVGHHDMQDLGDHTSNQTSIAETIVQDLDDHSTNQAVIAETIV